MTEREKALEEILLNLFDEHFFGVELEWNYNSGVSLLKKDPELYVKLCQFVPEAVLSKKV